MKLECICREFPGSIHYQRCSVRIFSELSSTLSISNFSSPQNATSQQWGWCWFSNSAAFHIYGIYGIFNIYICKEKESLCCHLNIKMFKFKRNYLSEDICFEVILPWLLCLSSMLLITGFWQLLQLSKRWTILLLCRK